ncbi:MAG: hypothetical protein H6Q71_2262 [Firmicutes bacterium]|nr:hypothetical protein [Bacillota bacterium]
MEELLIFHAGSLSESLQHIAQHFEGEHPGVKVHMEGSVPETGWFFLLATKVSSLMRSIKRIGSKFCCGREWYTATLTPN